MLKSKEIKILANLLRKIKNPKAGLPQEVFDALVKIVPFPSVELVIKNSRQAILLTRRNDQYWRGWHFPGGLLRYRESFAERLKKTARNELGVKIRKFWFLFPINYNRGPRGHAVSLLFLCEIIGRPKDGKFFAKMPKDIIPVHREVWKKVRKVLS